MLRGTTGSCSLWTSPDQAAWDTVADTRLVSLADAAGRFGPRSGSRAGGSLRAPGVGQKMAGQQIPRYDPSRRMWLLDRMMSYCSLKSFEDLMPSSS